MDLDEEGRRDLDEMDFWGLGRREEDGEQDWNEERREEDGEQDLKWRKKNGGRRYTEIKSLKLDLLQWNQLSYTRIVRYQNSFKPWLTNNIVWLL